MPNERWLRIIPVAFIMYTIAFVDRTNISLAMAEIGRDLRMDSTQQGIAFGLFFIGYVLLQIPGGYLAERWSAKRFVSALLVLWGISAVVCGLTRTRMEFWVMRFFLGVAEGGVWPATLVLLAHWFPRAERARANAYWMLCLPISLVVSSPISGWILGRWGWRVMVVSEGALPFLWLLIWNWYIDDHPHQARWISSAEREPLEATLRHESEELEGLGREPFLRTLFRPQVMWMVAIYFLLNTGNYGYLSWLPSAMKSGGQGLSDLAVSFLFAVPYLITAIGMVLNSRHSDRTRERRVHAALALAWGGALLLGSVVLSQRSPVLSFILISLVGAGSYGVLGPFWAIPTETLPRNVAGSAMGLVNAIGNVGGFVGPLGVGFLNKRTGNFVYGFGSLGVGMLLGGALTYFLLRPARSAASDEL